MRDRPTPVRPPLPLPPDRGPFRREFWKSPLRGPWLTSVLGSAMLVLIVLSALTGFASHEAYDPQFLRNSPLGDRALFDLPFDWPSGPAWLYAATQGIHVVAGFAAIPFLLAKLWSVIPKLFERPAASSFAQLAERGTLVLLVGGALFTIGTGVLNVQYWYAFGFSFVPAHYWGALIFLVALVLHVAIKIGTMREALSREGLVAPLRRAREAHRPEPAHASTTVAVEPGPTTASRRFFVGAVGVASAGLALTAAGSSVGGPFRKLSFLSPRGQSLGDGPNDFPINKTAAGVGIRPEQVGDDWRLEVLGRRTESFTRDELLSMPQNTERLPIGCVEGWSTTQEWTGVRLKDLARAVGGERDLHELFVESVQEKGAFRFATLNPGQALDERSLLALRVNGVDLSPDHGFPARLIAPAVPGVHCTKWVGRLTFRGDRDPDRGGGPA